MKRCDEYRELRVTIGTQDDVAEKLGITRATLSAREMGHAEIKIEAFLALLQLAAQEKARKPYETRGIRSV